MLSMTIEGKANFTNQATTTTAIAGHSRNGLRDTFPFSIDSSGEHVQENNVQAHELFSRKAPRRSWKQDKG
jgi:hypothetical protein